MCQHHLGLHLYRVLTVCLLDLHRLGMIAAWAERSRPRGSAVLSTVGLVDLLS